jgi:excisionase family DNA binding protein
MTARKAAAAKSVPKTTPKKKRAVVKRTLPGDGVELYSAEEIAARLRIGRTLVYYLMGSGAIESFKVSGLRRVTRSALEQYIEQQIEMTARRLA